MRIALIRRKFTPIGGAELYVQRLVQNLVATGHEVHLFAEAWQDVPAGAHFRQLPESAHRNERPWCFAEAARAATEAEQFDCVFSTERSLKQDVYRAGDGVFKVWLEQRRRYAPWWRKWFVAGSKFHRSMVGVEEQTFNPANTRHIIVNSLVVRNEILANYPFPPDRIHLIRNGVDLNRFKPGDRLAARKRYNLAPDEYVMLFVGSGWERKNLKFITNKLLPAVNQRIGPARLLVVGRGSTWAYNKRNVVFAGPQKDVEVAYHAADLFVFLPIYEPGANVCYEALACGVPVVTNSQNGGGEIVTEGINGNIVKAPDDLEGALAAIRQWMARRNQPIEVDRAALSIERNVSETVALLGRAAAERERK